MRPAILVLCLAMWTGGRPASAAGLVGIEDLLVLVEASVAEDVILSFAEANGVDPLGAEDLERLRNAGGSEALIRALEDMAGWGTEVAPIERVPSTIYRREVALATPEVSESEAWPEASFLPTESYSESYDGGGFGYSSLFINPFSYSYAYAYPYPYYGGYPQHYGGYPYYGRYPRHYGGYPYSGGYSHGYGYPYSRYSFGNYAYFGHTGGFRSPSHGPRNIHRGPVLYGGEPFAPSLYQRRVGFDSSPFLSPSMGASEHSGARKQLHRSGTRPELRQASMGGEHDAAGGHARLDPRRSTTRSTRRRLDAGGAAHAAGEPTLLRRSSAGRIASPTNGHESRLVALADRNRRAIARRANGEQSVSGHREVRSRGRVSSVLQPSGSGVLIRNRGARLGQGRAGTSTRNSAGANRGRFVETTHQRSTRRAVRNTTRRTAGPGQQSGLRSSQRRSVSRPSIQNRSGRSSTRHVGATRSSGRGRARVQSRQSSGRSSRGSRGRGGSRGGHSRGGHGGRGGHR